MYFIARGTVNGYQVFVLIRVEGDKDKICSKANSFAAAIFSDMGGIVDRIEGIDSIGVATLSMMLNIKCYFCFTE